VLSKNKGGRSTIFFDGVFKECTKCRYRLALDYFAPSGNAQGPETAGYYKSMCKECHSSYNNQKQKEKRYAANPEGYWICVCSSIVTIKRTYCYRCSTARKESVSNYDK